MPFVRALKMRFCMHRRSYSSQPRREVGEEVAHQPSQPSRQVLGHAADAEPARVHAAAADRLDDAEDALAVVEHVEDRRHRAEVLGEGAVPDQVAGDAEQLGQHDADHLARGRAPRCRPASRPPADTAGCSSRRPGSRRGRCRGCRCARSGARPSSRRRGGGSRCRAPRSTISSPSSCRTMRSTPCVPGCCGPRFRNMIVGLVACRAAGPTPRGGTRMRLLLALLLLVGQLERPHLGGAGRVVLAQRMALPRVAASGCGAGAGGPSNVMPNMSHASRSYQLADGPEVGDRGRSRRSPLRAAP